MFQIVSKRALPSDRKVQPDHEYGYFEPEKIPHGKLSIKLAMELLSRYYTNPATHCTQKLATDYKLTKEQIDLLVKHFQIYQVYMPKGSKAAKLLDDTEIGSTAKPVTLASIARNRLFAHTTDGKKS